MSAPVTNAPEDFSFLAKFIRAREDFEPIGFEEKNTQSRSRAPT